MEEKTNLGDKFVKASYALTQATIEHIDFYKVRMISLKPFPLHPMLWFS